MNIKTIYPLGKRVVIKPIQETTIVADNHNAGGFVVGVVYAVSDKVTSVTVGDSVSYQCYGGTAILLNGKTYVVIHEDDVISKVTYEN